MGKSWPFLAVIICGLIVITTTLLGAHIYRWEMITWAAVAVAQSVAAWIYRNSS